MEYILKRQVGMYIPDTNLLEQRIDGVIEVAEDYDEFLKLMEEIGCKDKEGKHLALIIQTKNILCEIKH